MWRAMGSLLVLRDQVNALAPNRDRASDGLVGDAAHASRDSDHNPHDVEGVGRDIVTALDLTHDPAGGFDSFAFADVLRVNRDRRIKYVISNHRIFSAGTWTWRTYTGIDPHINHVHVSVLDAVISDTRTPWNLEGFDMALTPEDIDKIRMAVWSTNAGSSVNPIRVIDRLNQIYANTGVLITRTPADLADQLAAIKTAALDDGQVDVALPPEYMAALDEIEAMLRAVPEETAKATIAEIAS